MKVFLKKIIPNKLIAIYSKLKINFFDGYAIKSYSQEGEDMILRRWYSAYFINQVFAPSQKSFRFNQETYDTDC